MVTKSPYPYTDGLVQERRNSTANALELRANGDQVSLPIYQWVSARKT